MARRPRVDDTEIRPPRVWTGGRSPSLGQLWPEFPYRRSLDGRQMLRPVRLQAMDGFGVIVV